MAAAGFRRPRAAAAAILAVAAGAAIARLASPPRAPAERVPAVYRIPAPPRPAPVSPAPTPSPTATPGAPVIRRILDTGGALKYGTWFWDEAGVPAGPLVVTVDLEAAALSVFRGGYEIGTTAVIYGADAKETPLGTFPILQKDRHHFSSTYNHAPMPYTLRLTGDGVSIHASEVAADYATHGCIGVPAGFAAKLFAAAAVGDRVVITKQGLRAGLRGD